MDTENAKLVFTKFEEMLQLLSQWDEEVYKEWATGVSEACAFNLGQPLIIRNEESKLISVNFDPQLTAVLREVKYMDSSSQDDIPESASSLYSKNDKLWLYVTNLDLTVSLYNKVRNTVLEVEFPLVEGQLGDIDGKLKQAEESLKWEAEGTNNTIKHFNFNETSAFSIWQTWDI